MPVRSGRGKGTYAYDTPTEHRGLVTSERVVVGAGLPGHFEPGFQHRRRADEQGVHGLGGAEHRGLDVGP